jgi:c-di-GMP-binding flagellar brake protein YcgR
MHERARLGQLDAKETAVYRAGRDQLARALLAAQRLTLKPSETPRQALRVSLALQVEIDVPTIHHRAVTLDISTGGFATLLSQAPTLKDEVRFTLSIPPGKPVSGRCRVTDVKQHTGIVRVSFQFVGLSEEERERLELFVFDTVLAQLAS